jgi:hypothetical protein
MILVIFTTIVAVSIYWYFDELEAKHSNSWVNLEQIYLSLSVLMDKYKEWRREMEANRDRVSKANRARLRRRQ